MVDTPRSELPLTAPFWPTFRQGFIALLPLWFGSVPFGVVYTVSALAAGLSPAQTIAMSLLVFAGSAQFTAVGLFAAATAPLTIVVTTLIVNARHLLLAASLAPHLRQAPLGLRALLAFQLTDESYAVGVRAFLAGEGSVAYQLGANVSMYVAWPAATIVGVLVGSLVPDPAAYGLDLVFPLTFTALLVPLLREAVDRGRATTDRPPRTPGGPMISDAGGRPPHDPDGPVISGVRPKHLPTTDRGLRKESWLRMLRPYGRRTDRHRGWWNPTMATVLVAAVLALGGALLLPGRWYILLAGVGASLVGAWLDRRMADGGRGAVDGG